MGRMANQSRERIDEAAQMRLAVLIDADNAQASLLDAIFEEVARYGSASVLLLLSAVCMQRLCPPRMPRRSVSENA